MTKLAGDTEFRKLVGGRCDVDLVRLMLEFAADAYPQLDRVGYLLEIDRLGVAVDAGWVPLARPDARERLTKVSRLLYEVEGFHGNFDAYYEPENSYLNEVLDRRVGIPISLGILYMAVAQRAGLRMFGVNTPGHFVVGCHSDGEMLLVDPFTSGDILNRDECRRRIEDTVGQRGIVKNEHFRPAVPRDIAARVLRNLKAAYAMQNRWHDALPVQQRLTALLPHFPQEQRDLGLIYLRTGQPREALNLLEDYVTGCGCDQAVALESSVRSARKMVAELN